MTISLSGGPRPYRTLASRLTASTRKGRLSAGLIAAIIAGITVSSPTQSAQPVNLTDGTQANCPPPRPKVDLAFILDRSGSLDAALLGQTYNIQIEGVLRALRDPTVIPRDGSVAVVVETFAGSATIQVPFRQIDSATDAEAIAAMVETLRCPTTNCASTGFCPVLGSNPASNYAPAIATATNHLNQNYRPGARQALLLSSDGQPSDLCLALLTAGRAGDVATDLGIQFELDLILLALDPQQPQRCKDTGEGIDQLVFPQPPRDLPGATLPIKSGSCNNPCASVNDIAIQADCIRQVKEFAEHTRNVLRGTVPNLNLEVNTEADSAPNTPEIGGTRSLRQAIERANSKGGATTITFTNKVRTITPLVPLPALTSPDIRIDGTGSCEGPACPPPSVTIDGSKTDTMKGEQHGDGILIRSNRDVVRGLRVINFTRAGIGIEPVIPLCDNVGFNVIERNRFENNKTAGVCVLDPHPGQPSAVFHNIGNTISMNDCLGSGIPIDLACDGPTPNDPGDLDEGPNTLLNFPDKINFAATVEVIESDVGVSLTGQVNGTTAPGALVEIFAVTSAKPISGGRLIDGVTFLAQARADGNGTFTFTGLPDSPTCGYTATATDIAGNTSEFMFPCAGFAEAKVTNRLVFKDEAVPNQTPQIGTFTIENTGCAPLVLRFDSITRNEFPAERSDDLAHFSIELVSVGPNAPTLAIQPGEIQTFTARFDPLIPAVAGTNKPPSSLVLPETTASTVTLKHNGCGISDKTISLTAHVKRTIRLINPTSPRRDPLVTLDRSGDVFTVTFSVYDSSRNVDSVTYQFLDNAGNVVPLKQPQRDLSQAIKQANLVEGQSFIVRQTFSNAKRHREVASVVVTLFDKDGPKDSASGSITSLTGVASTQGVLDRRSTVLDLPVMKWQQIPQTSGSLMNFKKNKPLSPKALV